LFPKNWGGFPSTKKGGLRLVSIHNIVGLRLSIHINRGLRICRVSLERTFPCDIIIYIIYTYLFVDRGASQAGFTS
jgi:hypothetical protein